MQILPTTPVSIPQFASLSFLVKQTGNDVASSTVGMGEPMIVTSPLTTLSSNSALNAIKELHTHLTVIHRAASTPPNKMPPQDRYVAEMFREEEKQLLDNLQIFHPLHAEGISMHYRLLRGDDKLLSSLSSHIMAATKMGAKSNTVPSGLIGIVFCVAVTGVPSACRSSGVLYALPQRMNDCTVLLTRVQDAPSAKVLLSTFLLAEDELRKSEEMSQGPNVVVFPDPDEIDKSRGLMGVAGMVSPLAGLASPIAGGLGRVSKRLSMPMMGGGAMGAAAGSSGPENQMLGTGVTLSLRPNSSSAALDISEKLTVLSVAESDTFLRKYSRMGQERKASLDLTGAGGAKSRFRRRKGETRDADLDNFDYKGPVKVVKKKSIQQVDDASRVGGPPNGGKSALRQPKKDTRAKTPASSSRKPSISTGGGGDDNYSVGNLESHGKQRHRPSASHGRRRGSAASHNYDDDVSLLSDGRSTAVSSVGSHSRMQVNIALNEDLSCSYKLSQLSSCSVEGVVQIQVKTSTRTPGPFYLNVRDPSGHVDALQENKKFAEDVSATIVDKDGVDHRFAVSIPKGDNYFPVLRYKCGGDLRPVPIRVQTRVKVDDRICRVALQISSNPNNEASLTDLTIIMGVPDEVRGESLTTQPAGGVWNESKRSVIWCVSELGSGEKFQLQARFEVDDNIYDPSAEKPKFPVLVRCQCLFAQLSDVELEVGDIPDRYPADVTMKLARRFRLSHRERS